MRALSSIVFVCLAMACSGDDGGGSDDGFNSTSCVTVWSCENNVCSCDDGSACDDADDCDVVCEVCS